MPAISPLLSTKLERDAWKDMERISKGYRDKEVHAYAVKRIRELGEIMMDIARDEIIGGDSSGSDEDEDEDGYPL